MELKLHHVNYSTKDVGAVAEFYRSLFNMKPVPSYEDARITSQGYDRKVEFLTDGTTEFHIAPQDLGVAFRTGQSLNPLDRGHIAFRTDDIEAFKAMLREKNIQFADYGVWAIGWLVSDLPAGSRRHHRRSAPDRLQGAWCVVAICLSQFRDQGARSLPACSITFTGATRCASAASASATWVNRWRASCSTRGHELWVHDVREDAMLPLLERQARRTTSPRELADACDTVIVSLPTLEIFRHALSGPDGLLAGKALKTLVNTCTVGVTFIREVETECAAAGVTVIDVPISGGVAGARAGTLAMMVSGDPAQVADLMPVFQLWGKTVVVAGDRPGAAQTMKLTNNMLCAVALVATSEAMTMSGRAGIPDDAMLQILNNGTGRNFATTHIFPDAVLPRTFDFGATIEILMKDVDLAIEQGEELGVPMWVSQAVRLVLKHGVFQGRAQQDMSRIVEIIEDGTRK